MNRTPQASHSRTPRPAAPRAVRRVFVAQMALLALGLALVTPVDRAWSEYLALHRAPVFTDWMRRTLFEGHLPGASDLPILFLLAVIVGYFWCTRAGAGHRARALQPALGYLFVTAVVSSLAVVHGLKWVLGRARPSEVLGHAALPFSDWFRLGPHYVADGIYRGSFPSGHTAAVFVLLGLAYVLACDPRLGRRWRTLGGLLGVLVFAVAGAMTVANAMARSHWLSDGVASMLLLWPVMHALYFWVLRVPDQRRAAAAGPGGGSAGRWEAWLCLYATLLILGLVLTLLGLRAPWAQSPPPSLLALVLPGVLLVGWAWPRLRAEYARFRCVLEGSAPTARVMRLW
ncbi:MAG: phosphatase PAP2 family protein [Candidatus Lambdaproteobacteria bacterium]|nr:phosphatase PAP2 family protein [Candidatus Lambdaproteobacteria bacterium]